MMNKPTLNKTYTISGTGNKTQIVSICIADQTCVGLTKLQQKWGNKVRTVTKKQLIPWYFLVG